MVRQADAQLYNLDCLPLAEILSGLVRGHIPQLQSFPEPDLLIAAGHGTHLSLLTARHLYGGRSIVLMQPSLPTRCFDLCLIPAHDRPRPRENIIVTDGALNMMSPAAIKDAGSGMILVGGPSRHHGWADEALMDQINTIISNSTLSWLLTDSPRTPEHTRRLLLGLERNNLSYHPFEATGPDWLKASLSSATTAWVTADSMSMTYEALSAGAAVGIITVPVHHDGRTVKAITQLVEDGRVTTYRQWAASGSMAAPEHLDEAERCAKLILHRLAQQT